MRLGTAALCGATLTLTATTQAARIERSFPDLSLEIAAPSPRGPWTMRIRNAGDRPARIPADVRWLRLSITPPGAQHPIACRLPRPLRPAALAERRALDLAPGRAYVETFDPRLFCFGARETDALVEDAVVRASLDGPREIIAPTVIIGPGSTDEATMPAQPGGGTPATSAHADARPRAGDLDAHPPRLSLEAPRFVEAARPRDLALRLVARNVGPEPMHVILSPRMLTFDIDGPSGPHRCEVVRRDPTAAPRPLTPGAAIPLTVRLDEACARDVFRRPGLYRVIAMLHADETARVRGATTYTGRALAPRATLVRIASAPEPFHAAAPAAIP